jgi:hypothetical protein
MTIPNTMNANVLTSTEATVVFAGISATAAEISATSSTGAVTYSSTATTTVTTTTSPTQRALKATA